MKATQWATAAAICALGGTPWIAHAQSNEPQAAPAESAPAADAPAAPSSREQQAWEEIVVTAQRRAENLQSVPIAATALSGDALEDKGVARLADLQFAAPSLSITDQGLTQSVNIRGIGIASGSPAVANGVATYIDGVFQPPILTMSSFYDIQNIEVLRGPQGTLVGSNSTGGAIFINTRNPSTDRIEGYAQASYGSYDEVTGQGAINLPVTGDLAVRASGNFRRRDSYYEDLGPYDNKPDRLNEKAGRFGVMWSPGDFRALGKVEWVDRQTGGYAYRPIAGTEFAADRQDDIRDLTYNAPTLNHERAFLASLELRYEFAGGTVLRSVSGYTNKRINNLYDTDGSRLADQTQDQFVRERQWSQEINLISPTDGAFDWILGGYYQRNKVDVDIEARSGVVTDPTDIDQKQDKITWGVFAQGNYEIAQGLEAQVGVRYSHFRAEQKGAVVIGAGTPIFGPDGLTVADLVGAHEDGRVTGKIGLNWNADADTMVYAFVARGYKPGGINSATSEFDPETVWDYEVGVKTAFLDDHVRAQLGGFYMKYRNFQFDGRDPASGQSGVFNISNATIKGIELQLQARSGGFSVDGGIAYVDSKLDAVTLVNTRTLPALAQYGPQCPAGTASNPPVCFDYTPYLTTAGGGDNLFSPRWSYNAGVQYDFALGGTRTLTPRLNYAYVGPRWTNLLYTPTLDYLRGRGLLSAQLTLGLGNWSIEAYGMNLANSRYVSGQSGNNEFYGAPREYGVRALVRF
ncbi:TonB-dependent receptor [Sphingomonas sp. RS6]